MIILWNTCVDCKNRQMNVFFHKWAVKMEASKHYNVLDFSEFRHRPCFPSDCAKSTNSREKKNNKCAWKMRTFWLCFFSASEVLTQGSNFDTELFSCVFFALFRILISIRMLNKSKETLFFKKKKVKKFIFLQIYLPIWKKNIYATIPYKSQPNIKGAVQICV